MWKPNFNIKKGVFEISIKGPDGYQYDLEFPSYKTEKLIPLDFGKTLCVSWFVDHDWIEYGIHTENGDLFHQAECDWYEPIEDQIYDMWYELEENYENFHHFIHEEILEVA